MASLRERIAAADTRERVELGGAAVEVRDVKIREVREFQRLSMLAAQEKDPLQRAEKGTDATSYLLTCALYDPDTGQRLYDPANRAGLEDDLGRKNYEKLGQAALRVIGLDVEAEKTDPLVAAKNDSGATDGLSTGSPATSEA